MIIFVINQFSLRINIQKLIEYLLIYKTSVLINIDNSYQFVKHFKIFILSIKIFIFSFKL